MPNLWYLLWLVHPKLTDNCLAYGNTINTANHTLVNWQLNMLPVEIPPRLITL
ncbi:hypothetical protein NWP22_17930 [Anabaenopsis tanganyikae CS-531]|uniref:Uncharacterized protein n=2 Tax=Anabaenopsis TaxID=110103 RepID=A0ABT6KIP0_9CYAN|nr:MULTISPECIES: hypothetical protein [Nostocales]MDB9446820.1 hypothetical protein [Anabaena sp. CS-542/02]MDB9540802.1 hypothetical protein [Anabaenopsis arnoldii]MDH6093240.1 hypothetical protein [Anabaenopsis arnoldii]MDH6097995.1 hypothetical protein [Anabaenopsis sp. FSS-46]MDH6107713.1 hypothetical protein [Anabaenopsis tanganyikae CS-531]